MSRCRNDRHANALCQCNVRDSSCFELPGVGTPVDPIVPDYRLDPNPDNMFQKNLTGLFSDMPPQYRNPPRVKLHRTVPMTIPAGALQFCEFNLAIWDVGGFFDSGGDAFRATIPEDGLYDIKFHVGIENEDITSQGAFAAAVIRNDTDGPVCYSEFWTPIPPDYIRDGSFESGGFSAWSTTGSPTVTNVVSYAGTYCASFSSTGTQPGAVTQSLSGATQATKGGDVFQVSCWIRSNFDSPPQPAFIIKLNYTAPDASSKSIVVAQTPGGFSSAGGAGWQRLGATVTIPAILAGSNPSLSFGPAGALTGDQSWTLDAVKAIRIGPYGDIGVRLRDSTREPFHAEEFVTLLISNYTPADRQALPNGGLDQVLELCWAAPLP